MPKLIDKTVNLNLVGLEGNAFNLLGQFKKQALNDGWTLDEIHKVIDPAMEGDYNHLVATLQEYCDE